MTNSRSTDPDTKPRFEDGRVGYAVGDIHGRYDLLQSLLSRIEADAFARGSGGPPILIFVGDYVDRGPQSREVIEFLLQPRLQRFETRFLLGNHEAALVEFINDPVRNRAWLSFGGLETLASYGVRPPFINARAPKIIEAARQFRLALPETHVAFLQGLELSAIYGDYMFVHAGVDARHSFDDQPLSALLWARGKFLSSTKPFPFVVVHGHTPTEAPFIDHRRIGIDTGAYSSGVLTAVKLWDDAYSFISTDLALPTAH